MRNAALAGFMLLLFALTGCATVGHNLGSIDNFDQVSSDLYRGAQPDARGVKMLASKYQVKTVINLRDSDDSTEARQVREAGMMYIRLPLDAETVTEADAEKFLTLLAGAPKPVFVHCQVGRDRTGMAVAAYRVREQGWTVKDAVADMYAHGHFWMWFPKVRGAIAELGAKPRVQIVADTPKAGTAGAP
jgi:protein tyrosine/serine phosphatase